MFGDGKTERDYTYVDDTVQGVLGAIRFLDQHPDTFEIVNLGESRTVPLTEMIDTVARTLGVTPEIERLPMQPGDVTRTYADISKAGRLFGYDPQTGKELFRKHCAVCHHIAGVGVDVAPDISDSRVKTPAQLLTDILNPNQAIDNNYVSYTIVTRDGNVLTGIISAETATSITLRQQENKTLSVLRADIEAIQTSGVSLMPEGFEKHLSKQQMADLIAFIKNWRYLEQPIPGTIGRKGD